MRLGTGGVGVGVGFVGSGTSAIVFRWQLGRDRERAIPTLHAVRGRENRAKAERERDLCFFVLFLFFVFFAW